MMGRIEAEERLARVSDGAIGAGNMKPADTSRIMRRLDEAAAGERRKPAKATPEALAAMGIGVVTAPPSAPVGQPNG